MEKLYGQGAMDDLFISINVNMSSLKFVIDRWQIEGWMDRMIKKIPSKLETFVLQVTVTIWHLSLSECKKKPPTNKQINVYSFEWTKIKFDLNAFADVFFFF